MKITRSNNELIKFDWKNTLTGTFLKLKMVLEEKLMMTLKELLEKSKYVSDDKGREIRFVDTNDSFIDSMEEKE